MQITLNGKDHTLYFGIRFIRELDQKYWIGDSAAKFGVGVQSAFLKLGSHDLVMLADVLSAALNTEMTFTDADFDAFFAEHDEKEIYDLCDELAKNLELQPMTKTKVADYKANLKKAEAKEAAQN